MPTYLTQSLHRAIQQIPDATVTVFRGRRRNFAECKVLKTKLRAPFWEGRERRVA